MTSTGWQAEILAGVNVIPHTGAVPGILSIKNTNVKSILPGQRTWMVATELGEGRVIVLAHEGYVSELFSTIHKNEHIAQLNLNIKRWLAKGRFSYNTDIGKLGSVKKGSLHNYKILVWNGVDDVKDVTADDLFHFVQHGGAVLHAMCSWGWLQLHPGKTLNDMPFAAFLDVIGVHYENAAVEIPKEGIRVDHLVPDDLEFQKITEDPPPAKSHTEDQLSKHWRSEILNGVDLIPNTGAVPGSIVVFGDQARPILSGKRNLDVWIAAAELGEGRVMVIAHEGYLRDFCGQHTNKDIRQLHNNMKAWLTRGCLKAIINCSESKRVLDPASVSIVMWTGQRNTPYTSEDILNYVISGGALVHACCPWGWLQVNKGLSFDDMPMADILDIVGIDYTERYCDIPAQGLDVCTGASNDCCHLGLALDAINADHRQLANNGETISLLSELTDSKLKTISSKLNNLVKLVESPLKDFAPSDSFPVKDSSAKAMMGLCQALHKTGKIAHKLPGIKCFPGDFDECPLTNTVQLDIQSHLHDIHPTGWYAKADEEICVTVLNKQALQTGWRIQIGAHSDCLSSSDALHRWPKIVCTKNLKEEVTSMKSDFGGLVYLVSPEGSHEIRVRIDNVVEAPLFDVQSPATLENWCRRRHAPGLWADLCGEFLIITLPSSSIRDMDNPSLVMNTWDKVLKAHFHLRGSNIRKHRRQWLVTDIQPSVGYMHSGYPVVTHLDVAQPSNEGFLLNNESLNNKGSWGVFHEFGHNMQRGVWTFPGTGEVTVNIFTLHAMQTVSGQQPWIHSWLQNQKPAAKKYLNTNEEYAAWKANPGIALFIYAQIAHNFGWSVYKEIFRRYERMDAKEYPPQEQDQIDLWYIMFSDICGHNLTPLVEFWKIPLSAKAKQKMAVRTPFLPLDEIIQLCEQRENNVLKKYTGCVRQPTHLLPDTYSLDIDPPLSLDSRLRCTPLN